MTFILSPFDQPEQGPGHLGKKYRRERNKQIENLMGITK